MEETPSVVACIKSYSIKKVAEQWDVSESMIYELIRKEQLVAFKIGSKNSKRPAYRVTEQSLLDYISANENRREEVYT